MFHFHILFSTQKYQHQLHFRCKFLSIRHQHSGELYIISEIIIGGPSSSLMVTVCVLVAKSAVPLVTVISITIVSSSKVASSLILKGIVSVSLASNTKGVKSIV